MNDFFRMHRRRGKEIVREGEVPLGGRRSVKDFLESLGVPHVEVGMVRINDRRASLGRVLKGGERIVVEASTDQPPVLRFACDIHLARLARRLRMAGFDTVLEKEDRRLAELAARENRVLLTRDIGLLKRAEVRWGYWVRHQLLDEQWDEIVHRFPKMRSHKGRVRCPMCNTVLRRVSTARMAPSLLSRTPATVRRCHRHLWLCGGCGRVYWPGSHHRRVTAWFHRKGYRASFCQ